MSKFSRNSQRELECIMYSLIIELLTSPEELACAYFLSTAIPNYNDYLFNSVSDGNDSKAEMLDKISHQLSSEYGFRKNDIIANSSCFDFDMYCKFYNNPFIFEHNLDDPYQDYPMRILIWEYYQGVTNKDEFTNYVQQCCRVKLTIFFKKLFELHKLFNMTNTSTYEQAKNNYKMITKHLHGL